MGLFVLCLFPLDFLWTKNFVWHPLEFRPYLFSFISVRISPHTHTHLFYPSSLVSVVNDPWSPTLFVFIHLCHNFLCSSLHASSPGPPLHSKTMYAFMFMYYVENISIRILIILSMTKYGASFKNNQQVLIPVITLSYLFFLGLSSIYLKYCHLYKASVSASD